MKVVNLCRKTSNPGEVKEAKLDNIILGSVDSWPSAVGKRLADISEVEWVGC